MSTVKKGSLFVKQVVALLKGDDTEALANKIARRAISAVEVQIASLKGKIVEAEGEVETATERLHKATYPTQMFTDGASYCSGIIRAQEALDRTKEALENLNETLKFWETQLEKY